jgi:hypothetical protein
VFKEGTVYPVLRALGGRVPAQPHQTLGCRPAPTLRPHRQGRAGAPRSIEEYLEALRGALAGADPALIQDALYDAEEQLSCLRSSTSAPD